MAIKLEDKTRVDAPDSDYPYGKIRDKTASLGGTPVNTEVYGDFHQFFAKMLAESDEVANGLPENAYSGFQYYEALVDVINSKISPVVYDDITDIFATNTNTNPGVSTLELTRLTAHKIGDMIHVNLSYRVTFLGDSGGGDTTNSISFSGSLAPNASSDIYAIKGLIEASDGSFFGARDMNFQIIYTSPGVANITYNGSGTNNSGTYNRVHSGCFSFSYKI